MSDYTADLDDLITDREHTEQDISLAAQEVEDVNEQIYSNSPSKVVVWPPTTDSTNNTTAMAVDTRGQDTVDSVMGNATVTNNTVMNGSQMAMSSSVFQMSSCEMSGTSVTERKYQVTEAVPPVSSSYEGNHAAKDFIVSEAENLVKKRKTKKLMKKDKVEEMNLKNSIRSAANASKGGQKYTRDSLIDLDNQIMDITTGFEAELESLIGQSSVLGHCTLTLSYLSDMYKGIQKRKSQGFQSTEKTSEGLSTLKSTNSSIRRCRVPANPCQGCIFLFPC